MQDTLEPSLGASALSSLNWWVQSYPWCRRFFAAFAQSIASIRDDGDGGLHSLAGLAVDLDQRQENLAGSQHFRGWIAGEYYPVGDTSAGLDWLVNSDENSQK